MSSDPSERANKRFFMSSDPSERANKRFFSSSDPSERVNKRFFTSSDPSERANKRFFTSSDPSGGFSKRFFTFQPVAFSFSGAALHSPAPFDRLGGGFNKYFQCVSHEGSLFMAHNFTTYYFVFVIRAEKPPESSQTVGIARINSKPGWSL